MKSSDLERERITRKKYAGTVYHAETITVLPDSNENGSFSDAVLRIKLGLVEEYAQGGVVVDLCCGSGAHLSYLSPNFAQCIGLDYTHSFLKHGVEAARSEGVAKPSFATCNARHLPLAGNSVDFLYSFSSLYALPGVSEVVSEIGRILRPGGRCILELGNFCSLNTIVCRSHPEVAHPFFITVSQMLKIIQAAELRILEHRAFQLLPMWSDRPSWMRPIHTERVKRFMMKRVRGKMVDEWVCQFPGIRRLAFRHIMVCERPES